MKTQIPKIYVSDIAAYNSGMLRGAWIDIVDGMTESDIYEEIQSILKTSPCSDAEEWAIHGYGFGGIQLSESEDLSTIADLARLFYHATYDADMLIGVYEYLNDVKTYDAIIEYVEDNYQGEYKSARDWAEEFLNETGDLHNMPEHLRYYFDYEKYVQDAEINGEIFFIDGCYGVHVFWIR